ncbi:hypothetical protein QL285_044991 [Trifolium repens]|nr:hypothetical protein QL285_044991 [Trifolium repens]
MLYIPEQRPSCGGIIWVTPSPSGCACHTVWPPFPSHTLRTGAAGLAAAVPAAAAVVAVVAAAHAGLSQNPAGLGKGTALPGAQRWEMTKGWPMVVSKDVSMRSMVRAITSPTWMGSPIKMV